MSDAELLHAYVHHGCEHSFSDIVARHIDAVYATALRQARNIHLAQEISHTVFALLARKAHSLVKIENLGGWLHRATCLTSLKMIRTECRRRDREQLATAMHESALENDERNELIIAAIDQAINE